MEVPRYWRTKNQRYSLIGEKCPHCDELIFPPRDICPNQECRRDTFTLPLTTKAERKYYGEKGVKLPDKVRSTRVDIRELLI
jgi:uncharacterized OB-fold protein